MRCFLAVCGHANIDVQLQVEELPTAGASTPVLSRRVVYGGTAANVARHAASLGAPTRLWARVGTDFPADWRQQLESDGLDLTWLDVDPELATPTCYVLTDLVERQSYCMDQGAMASMAASPPAPELLEDLDGWLHVCTGDPAAYGALMDAARERGIRVGFDPGQEIHYQYSPKQIESMLDRSDLFFANEAEMKVALDALSYGDPVQLLDHVEAVVATHGAKGASLYRAARKPLHLPAHPVRVVDPTGAGDALRAGWYAGCSQGLSDAEALQLGIRMAARICSVEGPQPMGVTGIPDPPGGAGAQR